jgi:hypothetical protein
VCVEIKHNNRHNTTYVEDLSLLRGGLGKGLVDQPRALVVLDISSNLANGSGVTVAVQVVILDLEVLAQGQENALSLLEGGLILDTSLF